MKFFKKLVKFFKDLFKKKEKDNLPSWENCDKASCWDGKNATRRMMNILSPSMSDDKFNKYTKWMKDRGCNTAHVIVCNQGDGEHAGYCIYGNKFSWNINKSYVDKMISRIKKLRKEKFAIVLWLFTDDSNTFNKTAKSNFPKYISDLKSNNFFDHASIVVAGLEINEYFSTSEVKSLVNEIRKVFSGMIGIHETPKRTQLSVYGDICFYQISPGASVNNVKSEVKSAINKSKKPVNMFEMERSPDRVKSEAAFAAGAIGVGNW